MAQPTGQSGGKTHWGLHRFDPRRSQSHQCYGSFGSIIFQWGMVAKHSINPKNFSYASTLTASQVTALPEEVDGKDRLASEQTLISNLYCVWGREDRMSYIKGDHTWIYLQQGTLEFWIPLKRNLRRNGTKLTRHSNYWHGNNK